MKMKDNPEYKYKVTWTGAKGQKREVFFKERRRADDFAGHYFEVGGPRDIRVWERIIHPDGSWDWSLIYSYKGKCFKLVQGEKVTPFWLTVRVYEKSGEEEIFSYPKLPGKILPFEEGGDA